MKKLFTLLTICLLFACGNTSNESKQKEEKKTKNNLIGSWDIFEEGYDLEGSTTFYNDGTALSKSGKKGSPTLVNYSIVGDGTLLCFENDNAPAKYRTQCFTMEWIDEGSIRLELELEERIEWFIMKRK